MTRRPPNSYGSVLVMLTQNRTESIGARGHGCIVEFMRTLIVAALLILPASAGGATKSPVVADKSPDQFTPAAFERQHIDGLLGARMRVNLEGRLLRVDEKALIE